MISESIGDWNLYLNLF